MSDDDLPPAPWILPGEPKGPFLQPRRNMNGRYLLPNPKTAIAMAGLDRALSLVPRRKAPTLSDSVERILVSHWAHLGDVVTTFGAIRALRDRFPHATIDMIVGSWARRAIEDSGLVDDVHPVDHWSANRSGASRLEKHRHYRGLRGQAVKRIKAKRYQVGIDFNPWFPPAHPLFYRAGIPIRVGFDSSGFGPLLTHPVPWPNARRPVASQYKALLDTLDPAAPFPADAFRPRIARSALSSLPSAIPDSPYFVLHPGAGAPYKDWGIEHWRALATELLAHYPHHRIVVTGAGASERGMAAEMAALAPTIVDMSGQADWGEFVTILAHAAMIVCPDTVTGHLAGAVGTPLVSIFTGTNITEQWQPHAPRSRVLLHGVECAPCNRPGCEVMACIRAVPVEAVMRAIEDLMTTGDRMEGTEAARNAEIISG